MKTLKLELASKPGVVNHKKKIFTKDNFDKLKGSDKIKKKFEKGEFYLIYGDLEEGEDIGSRDIIGRVIDWSDNEITVEIPDDIIQKYNIGNVQYYVEMCTKTKEVDTNYKVNKKEKSNGDKEEDESVTLVEHEEIECFKLVDDRYNSRGVFKTRVPMILVRYHRELCPELMDIEINEKGDFIDLRAAENVTLKEGESALISLGVSIRLPEGYWGQFVPRSSTYKNFSIIQSNSFAVIDESYCGDDDIWKMPVIALRDTEIKVNDRICQFRIVKKYPFNIMEIEKLDGENRGGFGSTGTN